MGSLIIHTGIKGMMTMSELIGCKYCGEKLYNTSIVHRGIDVTVALIKCRVCSEGQTEVVKANAYVSVDEYYDLCEKAWEGLNRIENPVEDLSSYLISDEYFKLLERAILSRIKTTSNNFDKHAHAIGLIDKVKLESKEV